EFYNEYEYSYGGAHARSSAAFVKEYLKNFFEKNETEEKAKIIDIILNHHSNSKGLQDKSLESICKIIKDADGFSSGKRGKLSKEEQEKEEIKNNPMISPFYNISNYDIKHYYELKQIDEIDSNCPFETKEDAFGQGYHNLEKPYIKLFSNFQKEFNTLVTSKNLDFEKLNYLFKKYLQFVPSADYYHEPDISLYDHLKTTTAIALCLKRGDHKPFLLIEGDISGIQNFIFDSYKKQESDKGGAKQIRGRSLFIHLLTDASVRYVLEKLKLPVFNVFLQSGGHFIILAPNTQKNKEELGKIRKDINKFLYEKYGTLISLVIASKEGTEKDMEKYANFKEHLSIELNEEKNKKFNCIIGLINKNKENNIKENKICPVCGIGIKTKGKDEKGNEIEMPCSNCKKLMKLGEKLVKTKGRLYIKNKSEKEADYIFNFTDFDLSYKFYEPDNSIGWKSYLINDTAFLEKSNCCGFMFLSNYVPLLKDDKIATFAHISSVEKKAFEKDDEVLDKDKLSKIAILKADIDNLGYIFAFGLKSELRTPSKILTMSFMFDLFFSNQINKLAKKNKIYVVFAGGDDLIVIGRFDKIITFAKELKENFDNWVCNNPKIHFSAGIVMATNKFPVKRLIKYGEDALEKSKKGDKNKITILDKTLDFEKYKSMIDLCEKFNRTETMSESA
ncbi:MAG: type III-A CRISPR-associated protein Cas10/Csm1, partial [Candidatus Aenigmarchaeota archaeon]|nr:type III-A CRISPR-associated protein Cas10/Csm1 [Candidatus Aenigmarchaeota archaeon]